MIKRGKNFKDLTGKRFGLLTVTGFSHKCPKTGRSFWDVVCDCGTGKTVFGSSLLRGVSTSCGCFAKQETAKRMTTHGKTGTFEHRCWRNMLNRCYNPRVPEFKFYGGRGIGVYRKWRKSFECFLSDMGVAPAGAQIERKNNNHGYGPSNCKWATKLEQANNTRSNRFIEHAGQRLTIAQWSRLSGISPGLISARLKMGWSVERALTEQPAKKSQAWRGNA